MGKVDKGVNCSIQGCGNKASRSFSAVALHEGGFTIEVGERRGYLCETHYREWKKKTKKSRELDRARFG